MSPFPLSSSNKREAYTNEQLVDWIKGGGNQQRKAINYLFDKEWPSKQRHARRKHRILKEMEVLEAYSDALVQLNQLIFNGLFVDAEKLLGLLHRIFDRRCIDLVRKKTNKKKEPAHDPDLDGILFLPLFVDRPLSFQELEHFIQSMDEQPDEVLEQREQEETLHQSKQWLKSQLIETISAKLSATCKALFLGKLEGKNWTEVAEAIPLASANVAKSNFYNCKQRFRKFLSALGIDYDLLEATFGWQSLLRLIRDHLNANPDPPQD